MDTYKSNEIAIRGIHDNVNASTTIPEEFLREIDVER